MKVPNKVKIASYTYTIEEKEDPEFNGNKVWGSCNYRKQQIVIDKDATLERKQDTVMHECLHACLEACDFDVNTLKPQEMEEYICIHLAPVLVEMLKNNPRVTKYLINKGV